jgi:hypothetical protein
MTVGYRKSTCHKAITFIGVVGHAEAIEGQGYRPFGGQRKFPTHDPTHNLSCLMRLPRTLAVPAVL